MLKIEKLSAFYDTICALDQVDLEIPDGEIRCIIGSNGAGKTTLLNSISGVTNNSGRIEWNGRAIERVPAFRRASLGIAHVPEGRQVFAGLTVRENLEVATIAWRGPFGRQSFAEELDVVYQLFPRLKEREKQLSWSMSGGEQQMLAVGRALMARPKIIMMDEPSMGLAPLVVDELFDKIVEINRKLHLSVLLVEQNAMRALGVSSYAYVLEHGHITLEGDAASLQNDERVVQAYLSELANW